ncbi:DUF3299 domain-containing protein [Pedobacter sp. SYSU D00535]|uniref:DUF3299 domain-containing protein n=1 Tax=Pedobacter sp. SYSU D00535 TaxID=2810308 RepID=UPI001A97B596|nr:DUF3299 domain-containing protein [Pedobacter sp. SYSU D00535]
MRKILLSLVLVLFSFFVKAQAPTHVPLMTPVWELIAKRTFKKNANFKMVPAFPAQLQMLQNKVVELPGYIIPLNTDYESSHFMLAVVPYDQCAYCGQGDIPQMVEVNMAKPLRYTDKPIKIRGKLLLNESGDKRSEVFLFNAEQVK